MKIVNFIPHFVIGISILFGVIACTPKVQLETPKEGITINMNVVVDHQIKVTVDKSIEKKLLK